MASVGPKGDADAKPHPARIGEYEVEECLGVSLGRVYRCRDNLGGVVVMKCITGNGEDDAKRVQRIWREAHSLVKLRGHPNIVHIHGAREIAGAFYLETEFIPGADLSKRLREDSFGVRHALDACVQIARGLEAAHGIGILHRDLKPRNIRVTPEGVVKIIDFGLAKLVDRAVNTDATTIVDALLTHDGQMLGTPGYMSPEQVRGRHVDEGSDIWAFGCVLYECLSKKRAFYGESPSDALITSLHGEPDMGELPLAVPERVRELVAWCLRKNREDRPVSMREVRVILDRVLQSMEPTTQHGPPGENQTARTTPGDARRHNLPRRLTHFVGRLEEAARVREALQKGRLAVLTGVGGSGKSRLAIEFGWDQLGEYADGVWFVELAPLSDESLVAAAVAGVLRAPERAGREAEKAIGESVGAKHMLLIIDNCEHLTRACASLVESLLDACPNVRVLATSREGLGVVGEKRLRLTALAIPEAGANVKPEELEAYPGVGLFVRRARLADARFELTSENGDAVVRICRQLDGLPLAINLVASVVGSMSVHDIAEHVEALLASVSEDGRTVEGSIALSYQRLSGAQQLMLQRLSVFEGGWTVKGAEAVCADGPAAGGSVTLRARDVLRLLLDLVNVSVVEFRQSVQAGRAGRYELLQTVRAYALQRLHESGASHERTVRRRFVRYIAELASNSEPHLKASAAPEWLDALSREHENIRGAMNACLGDGEDGGDGGDDREALDLAVNVHRYCYMRGHMTEGKAWLEQALQRRGDVSDTLQARGWNSLGVMLWGMNDYQEARSCFERSIDIFKMLGDRLRARKPLHNLALIHWKQGECDTSERLFDELIAWHDPSEIQAIAELRLHKGCLRFHQHAYDEAESLFHEAATTLEEPQRRAHALHNLGEVSYARGRMGSAPSHFEEAKARFERALPVRRQVGDPQGLARTMTWLGMAMVRTGDLLGGRAMLESADAIRSQAHIGVPPEDAAEYEDVMRHLGNGRTEPA